MADKKPFRLRATHTEALKLLKNSDDCGLGFEITDDMVDKIVDKLRSAKVNSK